MITELDNFTASIASFNETTGADISILHPTVLVALVPNAGYNIIASNFNAILPLPVDISNITFAQDGLNVNATITFISPFIMPQDNVSIPFCIDGFAELIMYSISGSISNSVSCNIGAYPASYSATGGFNTTANVLTVPIIADSGYYFPTNPTLSLTLGNTNNYTLSSNKVFDISGNLIEVDFTIGYTFPNANITGDVWSLNACAYEIYVPTIEITGYSISTVGIIPGGETRIMQVFGNQGATFTVSMDSVDLVTNIVMGSSGVYSFPITFPAVAANTTYTIELSGDLASPFLQQNPFTIDQRLATDVTLTVLFNSGITGVTPVVKSFTAFTAPLVGEAAFIIDFPWSILPSPALTGTQVLSLSAQPTSAEWSNLEPLTNGGTIIYPIANITLENPATTGVITVSGNIEFYGGTNMETVLDLTNLLTVIDLPELNTTAITNITGSSADSGGNAVVDNGSPVTAKGVEWSTDNFLSILGSTNNGAGSANYASSIVNLMSATDYYVRAYATNAIGTGYGNVVTFQSAVVCQEYTIGGTDTGSTTYLDCDGVSQTATYNGPGAGGYDQSSFCANQIVSVNYGSSPILNGPCPI